MKKNKKLLMFMALSSLVTSFAETPTNQIETKYDKIYNDATKNIKTAQSNEKQYGLIQDILNSKNRELNDLYMQENYIVKPEYLEWQIFFSGFYNEKNRGDNTANNAKYYSNTKKTNGDSTLYDGQPIYGDTLVDDHFKPYKPAEEPKFVELGISLDVKEITKDMSGINVMNINVPEINSPVISFLEPDSLVAPTIELADFNPKTPSTPSVTPINFSPIPILTIGTTIRGNIGTTGFFPNGDEIGGVGIISQMDLTSGTITVKTVKDLADQAYYSYTLGNVLGNPSAGLTYDNRYNSTTSTYEQAVLPTGVYSNSFLNETGSEVLGLLEVVDNPITRIGIKGSSPDTLKIILEGDDPNPEVYKQILIYYQIYSGIYNPDTGEYKKYTLDDMETEGWITSAEKTELGTKFLDTALGYTTANRDFQYVENNGTWNLKGSNVVGVDLQGHGGFNEADSIFMNRGNITGLNEASSTNNEIGKQTAFIFTEGAATKKQIGYDNTGTIEMRAPESVAYFLVNGAASYSYNVFEDSSGDNTINGGTGKHFLYNNGDIKLYGNNNIGVYTKSASTRTNITDEVYYSDGSWTKNNDVYGGLQRSEIKFFKPLTVLGDQSIGVDIERELNFAESKIKINVGTEDPRQAVASSTGVNGLENSGNITGGDALYTEGSAGIYVNMGGNMVTNIITILDQINPANNVDTTTTEIENPQFTLNDYLLNVGSYSRGGAGLRVDNYGNVILGASSDPTTSHEINLLAGGKNNAGIYVLGSGVKVTSTGLNLNIDGSEQVGAQLDLKGEFYLQNGNITVNGTNNTGIAVGEFSRGEISGTGNINVSAGNLGVYNSDTFNMTGGKITASGEAATAIYATPFNSRTNLSGGTVRAENGAIGLYSDRNTVMRLSQGINLQAGNGSLLFYNYGTTGVTGRYALTGRVGATIENGGTALYVKNGLSLTNYLTDTFSGTGTLDLTMQSGSRLFMVDGPGPIIELTTIDSIGTPGASLTPNVSINSASAGDYIPLSMKKGILILDRDINLDDSFDSYNRSELRSLSVTINNGLVMSGTQIGQIGIVQKNYAGTTGIDEITLNNIGIISQSGVNAIGLAADFGHIINANKLEITGDNSIGIVSANGTITENNGEIVIGGTDTAGIYGMNYFDGVTSSAVLGYGNDEINISNNNMITSQGTGKVYGIYASNTAGAASTVTLGSGSNIDLRTSNGAVGIYANKTDVTGEGTLTVGENGLGMYAKDSNVNLTGFNLNLYGNNSLGFYLDGIANFTGTGNIDIDGQNVTLFNVKSSGIFTSDFNVTTAAGSSYTIGNVNNGTFYYNGTANLGSNGSLINGINVAVLLDTESNITGTGSAVVGAALNGQYTGVMPFGFTEEIEGENRGTITLGDSSAGLYGINGARLLNIGDITVGDVSLGMSGTGTGSSLRNDGNMIIGQGSQGMYGSESSDMTNTGSITGSSSNATGMYADSASAMTINNTGTIDLQGNDTNGIYATGTGIKTIINSGTVTTGNSSDVSKPGVGIYSGNAGDSITNDGTIETGINSIGVYSKGGTINQNSVISADSNGTGIYADQTTVNLNTGSSLNTGDNNAVGVYAVNGSNIVNDGITTIGNGSYGYVLKSGSNLVNNTAATLGENAVLVYGDGAGTITNNGQLTMTGSNNVGIYSSNGGTVTNTADILGSAGQANMGIYNEAGSINNTGNISVGDSIIIDTTDSSKNSYAMGIYGDNSAIENHGGITVGANGIGIYTKNAPVTTPTKNYGNISSNSDGVIGIFADHSSVENYGDITLGGKNSIGIYGNKASNILNKGTITLNSDDSAGVLLNAVSTLDNQGTININGNNSNAVVLKGSSILVNRGTLNIAGGVTGSSDILYGGSNYPIPSIVNAGIIRVSENFEARGIDILIKVDPATIAPATGENTGAAFVSDAVKFYAPSFNTTEPIGILSGFTTGTHAAVYKFEDVFNPTTEDEGGPNTGLIKVKSKSLTWSATPVMNAQGNVDVWMEKIPYDDFTNGLWYEDFGKALDGKYVGSTGNAGKIFDKIDSIEQESDFRKTMGSLAGDVYANMNQREATIIDAFDTSLNLLQDSKNNTKENVKINVITGKGSLTENTDGVSGYDYETVGVLALREVERTYRHTFGYSLGYLHTGFEMEDGNDSEEWVDTIQLGAHSKYQVNDWVLRNDLMGRASIHNVDRNLDWSTAGRSEMNGTYESYSITSDNNLGKEISLGKNASVTPYGGLEATYVTRPSFTEDGLESLEVKGNDAWSVKPKLGVELKASTNESKNGWKLKGALDVTYEYELADLNEREYARLTAIENDYHKLSKPQNDKGTIRTKAIIGAEIEDRYGIFLTGDYSFGGKDEDEYRAGVTLKAVF